MKRLSGLDATFLYSETPSVHMHTLKVAVVEMRGIGHDNIFNTLRDVLSRRLHLLPPFRLRVVGIPFGLHHPVWIEDPHFDIRNHLRRVTVAAPGSQIELDNMVADIASRPLNRRRPLWEVWMVEGLANGALAFVAKVHHSVADGGASAELLANVMSPDPLADAGLPHATWAPEKVPSAMRLVFDALSEVPGKYARIPELVQRTIKGASTVYKRLQTEGSISPTRPFEGPQTMFNRGISANRSFATTSLPLAEVMAVRKALGCTVNDMVLALTGRAIQLFLIDRGEKLDRSLVATVPVSVAEDSNTLARRLHGNRLSNVFMSLCTDIIDPIERVKAINRSATAAKAAHTEMGAELMQEWAEFAPPGAYSTVFRLYSSLKLADRHRPPANVIVSNVRGPAQPLYIVGAKLLNFYSVGPILDGLGLNITAWSYGDRLSFSALADRAALRDAHPLTDKFHVALAEYVAAAESAKARG